MAKKVPLPASMDFYQDNTKLKWVILVVSVLISGGSIFYTNRLVNELKDGEKQQVELFSKALEYTLNHDDDAILFITDEILFKNKSIPVIWVNNQSVYQYVNVENNPNLSESERNRLLELEVEEMAEAFPPFEMSYINEAGQTEYYG